MYITLGGYEMEEEKEVSSERVHEVCHNPCTVCNKKGYLANDEICPVCAGTGCKDKKYCVPAGGLGCDS
jgi:hypothetical protein